MDKSSCAAVRFVTAVGCLCLSYRASALLLDCQLSKYLNSVNIVAYRASRSCSALTSACCLAQEYQQLHYNLGHKISAIVATGNGLAYSTGRLSYTFGLQVHQPQNLWT